MTTKVTVSVEGPNRVLVTQGDSSAYVSGKGVSGPKEVVFHIPEHAARKADELPEEVISVGAEEPDED